MSFIKRREMMARTIHVHRVPAAIAIVVLTFTIVYFVNFHQEERPAFYGMLRNQDKVNLRKLLIGSIQAAQRGGMEVLDVAQTRNLNERSKGKTDEGANDPFTDADGRSHCIMKEGLHRIFPRIKMFSEEDKVSCASVATFDLDPTVLHETADLPNELVDINDVTIWLDPLDATQEFTEKLYQYVTTMVCIAVKGVPVIGVIHSPFIGQTAWAWVDHSMSEYLAAIKPINPDTSKPLIAVSRSHAGTVKELTRNVFGEDSAILTAAGAGYKVLQVISNNATVYLHSTKIKKWDTCAGHALLNALGGDMKNLHREKIDYGPEGSPVNDKGIIASVVAIEEYEKKLQEFLKGNKAFINR
ncbi:putative inositol monophosphatase 3 [Eurosta solidaginis]|uniref:putative inositol monophosphatase 3 n=1 Tax=Eurosta solidaginis TaxID=178769 RepID=UPI003530D6EB